MTFGQSFQITPIQMAVTVSSMVNGGRRVTPHLGVSVLDKKGKTVKTFKYGEKEGIVSEKTSETMQELLEKVVSEGSGKTRILKDILSGKDGDVSNASKKRRKIYFFVYRICSGGRSSDSRNGHHP